jgi:hypothetical protein
MVLLRRLTMAVAVAVARKVILRLLAVQASALSSIGHKDKSWHILQRLKTVLSRMSLLLTTNTKPTVRLT